MIKNILMLLLLLTIIITLYCVDQNTSTNNKLINSDDNSSLKLNILVPPTLSTYDVKIGIEVNYDYPNSDARDVIKYECNDRIENNQFIETIVPQLTPGTVRVTCKIYYYEGSGTPGCDNNMIDWTLYCVATKLNVTVVADTLTRVPMDFICSENPEDFGDIEVMVQDVYLAKKVVGSVYKLPEPLPTGFADGVALSNVRIEFYDSATSGNPILIDTTSGNVSSTLSASNGSFISTALIPQGLFSATSTPTIWVHAKTIDNVWEKWEPVKIYQMRNEVTVIMDKACTFTSSNEVSLANASQEYPSVARNKNGYYVIVWSNPLKTSIFAQIFNNQNVPITSQFTVATGTVINYPTAAIAPDGSIIISWDDTTTNNKELFARNFDINGNALTNAYKVNPDDLYNNHKPRVAKNSEYTIIVWSGYPNSPNNNIYCEIYRNIGPSNVSSEFFMVNIDQLSNKSNPSVAIREESDEYVICWESLNQNGIDKEVYTRIGKISNKYKSEEFHVNQFTDGVQETPEVAIAPNSGNFIVTWVSDKDHDTSRYGIFARLYNVNSINPYGDEFQVNTYVKNNQIIPSISVDNDGYFLISWQSLDQVSNYDVFAQRFNNNAEKICNEFQVNQSTKGSQTYPYISVGMNLDSTFIIAWMDDLTNTIMFRKFTF